MTEESREVFLYGEIDDESTARVSSELIELDRRSSRPIRFYIQSHGGDLESAIGIFDLIQTLESPVSTYAFGRCYSAAPLLLISGAERYVGPHTLLMLHAPCVYVSPGSPEELKSEAAASEDLVKLYAGILAERTTKPRAHWAKIFRESTDHYFNAQRAITWGIAHEIASAAE